MKYLIITVILINFNIFAKEAIVKKHCMEVKIKSEGKFFNSKTQDFCEYKVYDLRECFTLIYDKAFNIDCKMFDKIKEKSK